MEISELITIIREDYLDDVFEGWEIASEAERNDQFLWSDKALLRYITEAQRQACNRTDFLYDETTNFGSIKLKAGVSTYDISPLITRIERVDLNNRLVTHISKEERDRFIPEWRTLSGIGDIQARYSIRGRKLTIYPTPDTNDADKVMQLSVWHLPVDPIASMSDELSIPDEYQRDLVWWVLYEAFSKQDADAYDKDKGLGYLAQFNQALGNYIPSEVRLNQLQEPEGLVVRSIDYVGGSRLNRFGNDRSREEEWYR